MSFGEYSCFSISNINFNKEDSRKRWPARLPHKHPVLISILSINKCSMKQGMHEQRRLDVLADDDDLHL